jgi:hypothetical protein
MFSSKLRTLAVLLLPLAACQKPSSPPAFSYETVLGVAVEKADRTCLDIRNGNLAAGLRIQLVTSSMPQTTAEAEITRKVDAGCTVTDQSDPGLHHYEFRLLRGSLPKAAPAFALASFMGTLTVTDAGVTGDLDGDGQPESFRSCTSSEGVHLTVWSGAPLEGRRMWHHYYYLGYDVDASCTDGDTKPDAR